MAENPYNVIVTDQAHEQLLRTKMYYAYKLTAPDAAKAFIDRMEESFASLARNPKIGSLVNGEPWRSEGIHFIPVKTHNIYFYIDEPNKTVWITAVVDFRMDQKKQLSKMDMDFL